MSQPLMELSGPQIDRLIAALESLTEGDLAVDLLIACGPAAISPLSDFLLKGPARAIALPRCAHWESWEPERR
ncbi:MAG: hypothetical protein ACP5FH_04850 [Terracidiphilus sp.]